MKPVIALLSICALGYAVDHWQELNSHRAPESANVHRLIIYGTKSCSPCIQLEKELNAQHIPFQKRDLADGSDSHELSEKLARIGKMGGSVPIPVADIDGVIVVGASIQEITRRMH